MTPIDIIITEVLCRNFLKKCLAGADNLLLQALCLSVAGQSNYKTRRNGLLKNAAEL